MSLANFLLAAGRKRAIDAELDAIFQSRTVADRPESTSDDHPTVEKKKRKSDRHAGGPDTKRFRPLSADTALPSASSSGLNKKDRKTRARTATSEPGTSHAEEPVCVSASVYNSERLKLGVSDEDEGQPPTLIHETGQKDHRASRQAEYAPPDETKEQRDERTIFIGNLAPEVAVKRPMQKQLHRHVLAFVPTAKIESTRFRSVPFKTPTSKFPEANDEPEKRKQPRQHERDRASSWRESNSAGESKTDEKKFLTPNQKKKIAFINRDIHSDADSVHAYIVFAYPPSRSRPGNLPPLPPAIDPFEAARLAVTKCNGTVFLDRILRVDAVVTRTTFKSLPDSTPLSSAIGDPKLSVFVGNLDFASRVEDLRVFFEGIMSAERGPAGTEGSLQDRPKCWVTQVRIVRDKDTQLGKGFAYVQFVDRTCVDEILAFEPGKLKFAKRKLRVQRCKVVSNVSSGKSDSPSKSARSPHHTPAPPVSKGDPTLGEKLVNLTKDERKRAKAADVERVARRVAKKKARIALSKQGVLPKSKQRERVRKTGAAKKLSDGPPKKASKGRIRSEKSLTKKNTKK